jgi:WD40 repeat protein
MIGKTNRTADRTVRLWAVASGQEILTLEHPRGGSPFTTGFASEAFNPNGRRLAAASRNSTITIWDASKSMKEAGQK